MLELNRINPSGGVSGCGSNVRYFEFGDHCEKKVLNPKLSYHFCIQIYMLYRITPDPRGNSGQASESKLMLRIKLLGCKTLWFAFFKVLQTYICGC